MNKNFSALFLLYFLQFIATSCDPCSCDPYRTFERTYNGIELKAWDTSGFKNVEAFDVVHKNSFGLTFSVDIELNQIAYFKSIFDLSSFGFTSAFACDCVPDEYININPVKSVIITVTDIQTQEIIDVTNNFKGYSYDDELTINELIEMNDGWHYSYKIDMTEYNNIPNSSIFNIKIILESGTELTEQTQEINFE